MKERIIDGFNSDKGFIGNNGFKVVELTESKVVLKYEVNDKGLNGLKIVHGGLLFGLADTAAGTLACMSGKYPVTISSNISYLNPAKCKTLFATAEILKDGNNIKYYKVDVKDENDLLICTCNVNMYIK